MKTRERLIVGIWAFLGGVSSVPAQEDSALRLRNLNTQLTAPSARSFSSENLLQTARERQSLLEEIIRRDPATAVSLALSPKQINSLPSEIQPFMEKNVFLDGVLHLHIADGPEIFGEFPSLETAAGSVSLYLTTSAGKLPAAGSPIRVQGLRAGEVVAVTSVSAGAAPSLAAATPLSVGTRNVIFMMVNMSDMPNPHTVQEARNVIFNNAESVRDYFQENSYGLLDIAGDVIGPLTLDVPKANCTDRSAIASSADLKAQAAGVNLSLYDLRVYLVPPCGLGNWGGGSKAWVSSIGQGIIQHEIGHNLKSPFLRHASHLQCYPDVVGPPSACTVQAYGDYFDAMGINNKNRGHFNAYHKEELGWLSPAMVKIVDADGIYSLEPYETPSGALPKVLKIRKTVDARGTGPYIYVEFRRPLGHDGFISGFSDVMNGVLIHDGPAPGYPTGGPSAGPVILDMTPGTDSLTFFHPALEVGKTFYDDTSLVTIKTISVSATQVRVDVKFGPSSVPCERAAPSIVFSPSGAQATQGSTVHYTAAVSNNDTSACPPSDFSVSVAPWTGWPAPVLSALKISLPPKQIGAVDVAVTSPGNAAPGAYPVTGRVVHGAQGNLVGQANAIYTLTNAPACVIAAPFVSLTPTSRTGKAGDKLTYTVDVKNQDNALCPSTVFNLSTTMPSAGWTTSFSPAALTLAPGAVKSAVLSVTSPINQSGGASYFSAHAAHSVPPSVKGYSAGTYEVSNGQTTIFPQEPSGFSFSPQ